MANKIELSVEKLRGRFYVMAGSSKLSQGFKTKIEAETDLEKNKELYNYWAKSATVGVQNTKPVFKQI